MIYNSGYDSTLEESYFAIAAAALARGYNVLAFDGPGQGAALREQRLTFRPDWEAVMTPVIDFALTRPEVAPDEIALFGYSLGGYLVARAAAFDARIAALILDDGIFDFHAAMTNAMPPFVSRWIDEGNDDSAMPVLALLMSVNTQVRWAIRNGLWVMGIETTTALPRAFRAYTLAGIADRITAPSSGARRRERPVPEGRAAARRRRHGQCGHHLGDTARIRRRRRALRHGAASRTHQVIFDWLTGCSAPADAPSDSPEAALRPPVRHRPQRVSVDP